MSKQVNGQGVSVLDISFIPVGLMGGGTLPDRPSARHAVRKPANFNPVPDNNLYSAILTSDINTGDVEIVGISDCQGQVYSWYVDLTNPVIPATMEAFIYFISIPLHR